jgi:thioredoxin reductase (NADPH)
VSPETPEQHPLLFPKLNDAQLHQLAASSVVRHVTPREILFDQETLDHGIFIVLEGSIEIVGVSNGVESVVSVLGTREFSGEVTQLSGRRSLVLCRACESSSLLELSRSDLRRAMQTDAALGDIFLSAFLQRRVYLIANSVGDAVLIGSSHSSDTLRLRAFLGRNGLPHTYLDVDLATDIQVILDHFSINVKDIPVLICRGQLVLRNPSNAEAAECFDKKDLFVASLRHYLVTLNAEEIMSTQPLGWSNVEQFLKYSYGTR